MESQPVFSVIIPSFNRAYIIGRAIQSVLNQSFQNFELIVVDDGSEDNTKEVVKDFVGERVRYFFQNNAGVSVARNKGAKMAKGENLIFLDSDDELEQEALRKFNTAMHHADIVQAGYAIINTNQVVLKMPEKGKFISKLPGSFCIKKSTFEKVSGYDEQLTYSENTELFHRLVLQKAKIQVEQFISLKYYNNDHGGSKNRANKVASLRYILEKHVDSLNSRVKFLYSQIIGVESFKEGDYQVSREFLFRSLKLRPLAWKCVVRIILSYIKQPLQILRVKTMKD
ncbi:glycosyltransferase family 2 protein [Echinicola sp. CAU 1574]|uniref:Glycosyltransferase family 2 protein n=1 Tax=Echinicola arenosa TaxID=2774144 RepID=A0ABR9AQ02_9BACT|nr:glycosyltransferase family A protein [Echinicola arenosa]MBD8490442.1 glycosyltransferase family 2 protein [Echinicola arenosa]